MRLWGFVIAGLLSGLLAGPALAGKRVALVIGNSSYQNVPRLSNPANDAAAIAAMLKGAGFDSVESKSDLKALDMRRALRDFGNKTRDADVAVIYYAGHGIEVDNTNYLIPVDAQLESDTDVYDEAFPLDRILVATEPARQLRLVILDACRDNPFAKTMKRAVAQRSVGRGLAKVEPSSPNTIIAFAAKAGSTAADGDGANSPFASALSKHLPTPGLDLRKAFGFVRDDVLKATGNRQEPYFYGSLGGNDVALVPQAKAAGPQGDPQAAVRRDYELALQVGSSDAWEAFLRTYRDGFYADLAKEQLRKLVTADTRTAAVEKARQAELDKAAAAEKARLETIKAEASKKEQLAALSPPAEKSDAGSQVDLPRLLQAELRRVGCSTATVDGNWNPAAQRSLELFNKHAGTKLEVKTASADALDAIRAKTSRVCPLVCAHGSQADGDRCVKITCRAGYYVNDDNECEKAAEKKPQAKRDESRRNRDAERRQVEAKPAKPQASGSGQIICGQQGCRQVRPGCYISGRATTLSNMYETCR